MKRLTYVRLSNAHRDIVWGGVTFIMLVVSFAWFDVFEWFFFSTRVFESFEIDELFLIPPSLALIMGWYAMRRWREAASLAEELAVSNNKHRELSLQFEFATRAGKLGVWSCDFSAEQIYFNSVQQDIYQIPEGKFTDMLAAWRARVVPSDLEISDRLFKAVKEPSGVVDCQFRVIHPDTTIRRIHSRSMVEKDPEGKILRVSGVDQDVTDQTDLLEMLKLRLAAIEAVTDGLMITGDLNQDCAIEYVNPAFERLTGYRSDEVVGQIPCFMQRNSGATTDVELFRSSLAQGQSARGTVKNYRKDGTPFWIELSVSPVTNSQGEVTNFVGVQHDVTDREASRRQLLEYSEMLRAISHVLSEYVKGDVEAHDVYGMLLEIFLDVTESAFGFIGTVEHTPGGAPYLKTCAISQSIREEEWASGLATVKNGGLEFYDLDTLFGCVMTTGKHVISNNAATDLRAGGETEGYPHFQKFLGIPLRGGGNLIGVVGVANRQADYDQDLIDYIEPLSITTSSILLAEKERRDREAAEETIRQSQKMDALGRLSGGLAHEYNNVLGGVRLYLDLALDTAQSEKTRKHLERSIQILERGSDLTHSLLAFARRQEIAPATLGLSAFLYDLRTILSMSVGEDVDISFNLCADWSIKADPSLLQSTIINLVLNARDAVATGGAIEIMTQNITSDQLAGMLPAADLKTDGVMLSVTDNGSGIGEEDIEKVFDPFFSAKQDKGRAGLGLSIVHGFVTQSGGRIWLESEVNSGTIVRVVWPRSEEERLQAQEMPLSRGKNPNLNRILLVEDRDELGDGLKQLLESLGYSVTYVTSGTEAVRAVDSGEQFDLVLADVMMPGGVSGADVARKALQATPPIATLFMSGYADEKLATLLTNEQRQRILRKPFGRKELIGRLSEYGQKLENRPHEENTSR